MNGRALGIIGGAFIVLVAIAFLLERPTPSSNMADSAFAPQLKEQLNEVEAVVIRKRGNEIVATLNRSESGWTVAERDDYRADTARIRAALSQLADATIVEAKTANPELFDRLGLEDIANAQANGLSIGFLPTALGLPGIVLGNSEGTSYRYARLTDSAQSYLINVDPDVASDTAQWLLPEIIDVRGQRVERILIQHADGERVDVFKAAPDQPNFDVADVPQGRELQYPGVANILGNALRELRLEDVAAFAQGTAETEVTTEFQTFDGLIVRAQGMQIEDEGWLVFAASIDETYTDPSAEVANEAEAINTTTSGWRFRIPSYQYSQIARRMTDLLSAEDAAQ